MIFWDDDYEEYSLWLEMSELFDKDGRLLPKELLEDKLMKRNEYASYKELEKGMLDQDDDHSDEAVEKMVDQYCDAVKEAATNGNGFV